MTHVQIDELNLTPDEDRRRDLQRLTVIGTYSAGAILDVSKFDMCTFASEEDATILRDVMQGNAKHAEDALILLTALRQAMPLVTDDDRLQKQCRKHGVTQS